MVFLRGFASFLDGFSSDRRLHGFDFCTGGFSCDSCAAAFIFGDCDTAFCIPPAVYHPLADLRFAGGEAVIARGGARLLESAVMSHHRPFTHGMPMVIAVAGGAGDGDAPAVTAVELIRRFAAHAGGHHVDVAI